MCKKILLVIILLLFNSCYFSFTTSQKRNYYTVGGNGCSRPIKPHFRLALPTPYQLQIKDNIDTTSIYINKDTYFDHKRMPLVTFLRFFANGRCASGFLYKDSLQYNAPSTQWIAGYYRMITSTEANLEQFIAHSDIIANYENSKGIIRGDTIYIFSRYHRKKTPIPPTNYKKWTREKENISCSMYIKQKVDTLTGTPDW